MSIEDEEIVLVSRIKKGEKFRTGIKAEIFFDLLFFVLSEIEIFDSSEGRNITWDEFKSKVKSETRKLKIRGLISDWEGEKAGEESTKFISIIHEEEKNEA